MQPLFEDDEKQCMYDDTIHVTASGTVTSVNKETCSFIIFGKQYVCGQHQQLVIHGHTNKNSKWKNPSAVLPRAHAVIGFDGFLDRFESYIPQNQNKKITCVVVALQTINFLQDPPGRSSPAQGKDVRERVKNRKRKRASSNVVTPSTTPSHSQASKVATSSGTLLGDDEHNNSGNELENAMPL